MDWSSNAIGRRVGGKGAKIGPDTLKDIFGDGATKDTVSDLPRGLALLDIEPSLPKLSVLPAGGTS